MVGLTINHVRFNHGVLGHTTVPKGLPLLPLYFPGTFLEVRLPQTPREGNTGPWLLYVL